MDLHKLPRLFAILTCGCMVYSCSQSQPPDDDPDDDPSFTASAFDGDWTWYEDGIATIHLRITQGQIEFFQDAGLSGRRIAQTATNCDIDPRDGLLDLAYHQDEVAEGLTWRISTTFHFNHNENPGVACRTALANGTLRGKRIVTRIDHDDIYIQPPTEEVEGELRRRL